jgi:hypothetical protein
VIVTGGGGSDFGGEAAGTVAAIFISCAALSPLEFDAIAPPVLPTSVGTVSDASMFETEAPPEEFVPMLRLVFIAALEA